MCAKCLGGRNWNIWTAIAGDNFSMPVMLFSTLWQWLSHNRGVAGNITKQLLLLCCYYCLRAWGMEGLTGLQVQTWRTKIPQWKFIYFDDLIPKPLVAMSLSETLTKLDMQLSHSTPVVLNWRCLRTHKVFLLMKSQRKFIEQVKFIPQK